MGFLYYFLSFWVELGIGNYKGLMCIWFSLHFSASNCGFSCPLKEVTLFGFRDSVFEAISLGLNCK